MAERCYPLGPRDLARLAELGWLHPDGTFTELGRAQRRDIEAHTDRLANEPFRRLGPDRAQRLIDLHATVGRDQDRGGRHRSGQSWTR